jgi:predicted MPP superfamily phosphohydrolase
MSFFLFFLFWVSLIGLGHWYVGRRLINAANLQQTQRRIAWLVVGAFFLIPQIPFFFFLNRMQSAWLDAFSWGGYVVLGFFSLLLTLLLVRDIALLARRFSRKLVRLTLRKTTPSPDLEADKERRRFLIHSTNLCIVGLTAAATGYGFYEARRRATIEHVDVPLAHLPPEFDGFRIVQFTDLHIGATIKRGFVEGIVEQLLELKGDLVAFTGDLADGSVPWLRNDVAPLREVEGEYGKFFITGNHEYYSGVEPWVREATNLGFDVLLNEHRIIQRGEGRVVLAGVTDYSGGDFIASHRSDPLKALEGAPEGLVHILLAHQPRSIHTSLKAGVDLQISGHTHGGQFFPWSHLATLNQPYIKGLHKHESSWIYVSRGTGYWGPPLRLGIPPEITVITLRKA